MEQSEKNLLYELQDAIMERPYGFEVEKKRFYIYPITLGKSFLLSNLLQSLDLKVDNLTVDPALETIRAVHENREIACRIIAYCTAKDKSEIFNTDEMDSRIAFLQEQTTDDELAQIILLLFSYDKTETFIKHFGLDKEQEEQAKITKLKNKDGSSVIYGGKSLYGSLIGVACEKFGWSLDYVVWGISIVNLRMMIADAINSIYLTKEERKAAHITAGEKIIDMNNPIDSWALIKSMKWD